MAQTVNVNDQLESIIDHASLADLLSAISLVCNDKGRHLRDNWQDEKNAREWERMSDKLDKLSAACTI